MSAQTAQWVMLGTRCRGPSLVCARCLYNPPRPPSVSIRSISTPTSEEQSADPAGSRSWTGRARSGTLRHARWEVVHAAQERHELLLGLRGYRFAANSVMPETNEGSSIAARSYHKVAPFSSPISNPQSRLVREACQGGNRRPSKGMLFSFHTFKRISTLFSRHFAISSRRTRSLGAFGAMSTSPSPARDLEVPMSAAQDLYLQLKISEFCERCCVWKISDRHLRSPLNKSTGVPQRS